MSHQAVIWARGVKAGSATAKAVLLAVASYADADGACWPSQTRLAEDTELSRHSVMRALDHLEKTGLLTRQRQHRDDGARTNDILTINLSGLSSTGLPPPVAQSYSPPRSTELHPPLHRVTPPVAQSYSKNSHRIVIDKSGECKRAREAGGNKELSDDANKAVLAWNAMASEIGLPTVQRMTEQRKKRLAARLRDCGGIDGWNTAIGKIRGSPFCRGETGTWRADFDFVLQESSFVKLMEGKYDGRGGKDSTGARSPAQAMRDAFDEIDAHIAERRAAAGHR